jgi:CheY-like chemotaxis protein
VPDNPSRVVVVDGDLQTLKLCERALRPPRFEAFIFDDACPALMSLRDLAPDLIVCTDHMPWIDLKAFKRTVRSAAPLVEVPFLFLATDANGQREIEAVMTGGDQCLRKPVTSEALLDAIRKGARPPSRRLGAQALLSGNVDRGGLIGLLKLCEDARLTGRLLFEAREQVLWFDWLAGVPAGHGASPADPQRDVLDRLLDAEAGRYAFEPRPIGARGAGGSAARGAAGAARGPIGRFSILEVDGKRYQIHTESLHSPNFAVTTVIAAFGQALRKLETSWPHPMKRQLDHDQARALIDRQHDNAMQMVRDGVVAPQPLRKVWDVLGGGVEGSQLLWVMSLLRDLARERLGFLPALALLRRSHRRLAHFYPALEAFEIGDDGRVGVRVDDQAAARTTLSGWRLPRGAVRAVAAWALAFRDEATRLAGPPRLPTLKKATRMIADDLEELGFYAALEEESGAPAAGAAGSK